MSDAVVIAEAAADEPTRPVVAYFVNQYPKVSHSFIRREILALERQGVPVLRTALRGWDADIADPADRDELARTRHVLRAGLAPLLATALGVALQRPRRFLAAMKVAMSLSRRSDRSVLHHLAYLAEACTLLRWLDAAGIRHLHAHFGTNSAEVAWLTRLLGGPPFSFTVHGPEEFDHPSAISLGAKAAHAAFVVAISSYGRSQLYRWMPAAAWDRVHVVRCGIDAAFHADAPTAAAAVPRLVCVGRLCEQKGQLLLVRAVARLVADGVPVELVLAGDGELRAEIERSIAALGLQRAVRITGWIGGAEVRGEMLAARALVLPSFAEGLPVVLMEAMALRRPVVSTYVAGIPELVRSGEHGWLVPAGDLDALVSALRDCLAAPAEVLSAMGDAARERVLALHDVDTEAARLRSLFEASIGSSIGTAPRAAATVAMPAATLSPSAAMETTR